MRALFIANDPTIFVADSRARRRMREYASAIGELHIVSAAPAGARPEQEGPLFLHPVKRGWFRYFRMQKMGARVMRTHAIDVVSAQDAFEHGRIARNLVAGTRVRLHIQIHTDFLSPFFARESWKNWVRVRIADTVLPDADGVRAVSERVRHGLLARYGERIVDPSVLPIAPLPITEPEVPLPAHSFSFTLLAVGRLEAEKRIEDILEALLIIRRKYSNVGVMIAGSGRKAASLQSRTKALGLEDAVVFLGERADAPGLMRSASAFIQASSYEGYSRTLIEAALARLPIVTTDVGIVGDVLVPEREVLATPPHDPLALATQVMRLIEDNQLRRALSVNAEAAVLAHLGHYQNLSQLVAEDLMRQANPVRMPTTKG